MSLQTLNAHNGERYPADTAALASVETFKSWLLQVSGVTVTNQVLLTTTGKQVKEHSLRIEVGYPRQYVRTFKLMLFQTELFLYDKQLIAPTSTTSCRVIVPSNSESNLSVAKPPESLSTPTDLYSWRALFRARRDWALDLLEKARAATNYSLGDVEATTTIQRGVDVALGNLETHINSLQQRQQEAHKWAEQTAQEQDSLLSTLDTIEPQLQGLPAKREFVIFFPAAFKEQSRSDLDRRHITRLVDLVDASLVDNAVRALEHAQKDIDTFIRQADEQVNRVVSSAANLDQDVERTRVPSHETRQSDLSELFEEIDVLVQKLNSDSEHVESLTDEPRSCSQAMKMASLHTRNYLPTLQKYCSELSETIHGISELKESVADQSIKLMRQIAATEANFGQVNNRLLKLEMTTECGEAFDFIDLINQLPFTYGVLLVETVRRKEWADKVKNESSILAEDIAAHREEEERRRRKWFKNIRGLLAENLMTSGKALHFDVNIKSEESEWPVVTRGDVTAYMQALMPLKGLEKIAEDIQVAVTELDQPSKRQIKKAKGFKMGSVHDASISRGSFLLRENDELRILRDLNAGMDSELKAQRSRLRKLEELVTGPGGSMSRPSIDGISQISEMTLPEMSSAPFESSPRFGEPLPRKASVSSRRMSFNRSRDDQALARRVVILETELAEENKRRHEAEKDLRTRNYSETQLRKDVEESRSTYKDLMENMESQQREFTSERRLLEEELSKQKIKVEEFEDELDRILGSRDNEKIGVDRKVKSLESELEEARQALSSLIEEARRREEEQQPYTKISHSGQSVPIVEEPTPQSISVLIGNLEALAVRSARHVKDLAQAVATTQSENENLQMQIDRRERNILDAQEQSRSTEVELSNLRNEAAAEKAKSGALATELEDGRTQLRILRAKFAEGETGSDSLRQRLEEQAARAGDLAAKLAEAKSHVNSLDVELSSLQRRHNRLQTSQGSLASRLEHRSARDKELTNRLVARNEDLARLLDSLGLTVTYRDGALAVQRTSKLQNASTLLTEPSTPLVSNGAAQFPFRQAFDVSPNPASLQWMHAATIEEENEKFTQLLVKIDELHVGTVSEAIIKLRRDVEWTGKKWKNEARNYRDRYHKAKMEGNEKIAFRSFKEGDLALFLPTRNQATRPWAAFNVGAPHYFLKEQDSHRLQHREWLVARIGKMQERVVDLSKMIDSLKGGDGRSIGETSDGLSFEDDNPFELSDGLRWYLLDATEEKSGAPTTPGPGKTTVASANVDAKGSIRLKKLPSGSDASGKLNKSLESRRSSGHSKQDSMSGASIKDVTVPESCASPPQEGIPDCIDIKRKPSTNFRPGSHASNSGPRQLSGLAIEFGRKQQEQQEQPQKHPSGEEVRQDLLLNKAPLSLSAAKGINENPG